MNTLTDIDLLGQVRSALKFIPSRPSYHEWIMVIAAIGNSFSHDDALTLLLERFRDEEPNQHFYKLQHRLHLISLSSLFFIAKQYGYRNLSNRQRHNVPLCKDVPVISNCIYIKSTEDNLLWHFEDDVLEERAAIYQYYTKVPRQEAEKRLIIENPNAPRQRCYRIAINKSVRNKSYTPELLTTRFENLVLPVDDISSLICEEGFAFCCGVFQENEDGGFRRSNNNWIGSELLAVDIDGGMNIEEALSLPLAHEAILAYTTPSHTPKRHRFRLLFRLPHFETSPHLYKAIVQRFIEDFRADKQCSDCCRAFFGNSNATILHQRKVKL